MIFQPNGRVNGAGGLGGGEGGGDGIEREGALCSESGGAEIEKQNG